jgi:uncharacterized 2Fe-2S/4Fe-4S cluster protein (DUF4445 family)
VGEIIRIELRPSGRSVDVERGSALRDVLFDFGMEFPCGGRGRCKRCRVQVLEGELSTGSDEEEILTAEERSQGWHLACRGRAEGPLALEVEQLDAPILGDHSAFEFEPRTGFAAAVDLGTTTVVAQIVDLQSGHVLASHSARNPQAAYGSDIMSRVHHALEQAEPAKLTELIRREVGRILDQAIATAGIGAAPLESVVLVGNTVMHHLFCGLDVAPLARLPYEPENGKLQELRVRELGWSIGEGTQVHFLPCLGGFVGSDVLAGVLATRMHESDVLTALVDLGTNGEIVVGTRERLMCTSTAAGPAFEAGCIERGMQAAMGAIDQVRVVDGEIRCHAVGGGEVRGICGSGLVDAVAAGLELGRIEPGGRLAEGRERLELSGGVYLTQADIRQLQLAKGAIAAGLEILLGRLGARPDQLQRVYLAGAFGNYVNRSSAQRIGLIPFPEERFEAIGNSALLGAKLMLFESDREARELSELRARVEHVSLAADASFQDVFVRRTRFPG